MDIRMNEYGFFDPAEPFENMKHWDEWQLKALENLDFVHENALFSDAGMTLKEVTTDHGEQTLGTGSLSLTKDTLTCANHSFPLSEIQEMSPIQSRILVFTHQQRYYEIRAKEPMCMRKYYHVWKFSLKTSERLRKPPPDSPDGGYIIHS